MISLRWTSGGGSVEERVSEWFGGQGASLSKVCPLPATGCSNAEVVAKAALSMMQKAVSENDRIRSGLPHPHPDGPGPGTGPGQGVGPSLGITSLGLSVASFSDIQTGSKSIKSFFSASDRDISHSDSHNTAACISSDSTAKSPERSHQYASEPVGETGTGPDSAVSHFLTEDNSPDEGDEQQGLVDKGQSPGPSDSPRTRQESRPLDWRMPLKIGDVDPAVLQSLPVEIQLEIKAALLAPKSPVPDPGPPVRSPAKPSAPGAWTDVDPAVFNSLPASIQEEIRSTLMAAKRSENVLERNGSNPIPSVHTAPTKKLKKGPQAVHNDGGIMKFCKKI